MAQRRPPAQVREPVQVYLDVPDRAILERAAVATGLPRAEVLRRGLRRFAAELLADESPALAFLESAASAPSANAPSDVAARHDEYLADWEIASWGATSAAKKPKPKVK
ncbi:MAG: hypothetical protein Q8K82_23340 [Gemmatimonadaceae bacterium]|nr:hypothetical protein [Gemmatimonadaceae bacterium]